MRGGRADLAGEPGVTVALTKAELAFVTELVRRITEEGWGPLDLWRELQADCARRHEANKIAVISSTRASTASSLAFGTPRSAFVVEKGAREPSFDWCEFGCVEIRQLRHGGLDGRQTAPP